MNAQFDARAVQRRCNGMLPIEVYERIYRTALSAPEGNIVEVGCAHGAATVCLAAGLRDSGRPGTVYTFEKIVGGSREEFGGIEENTRIIQDNFAHFGLSDRIELCVGDVQNLAHRVPGDRAIGLLCIDADGALDRDFRLFFDRVSQGAPVILDDSNERTKVVRKARRRFTLELFIDQKHYLTARMLDLFRNEGLLDQGEIVGSETWFGKKMGQSFDDIDPEAILAVYRSIIFADGSISVLPMRQNLANLLRAILPRRIVESLKRAEGAR